MTLIHPKTEIAEDQPGVEAEMAMKVLVTSVTARNETSEDTEWTDSLSGTLAQGFASSV